MPEVRNTQFPEGYVLPTLLIQKGYTNPLKHLRKCQCGITTNHFKWLLKQLTLSLKEIAFEWYCSFQGIVISA